MLKNKTKYPFLASCTKMGEVGNGERKKLKKWEKRKKLQRKEPKEIWTGKLPREYHSIRKYSRKICRSI